ncbi:5-oxoprolinase subunit PxpA [Acuticoccus sp. MNP-M23]|uniref:LamB/YcsF family protein n=1 Tax=Acuticoccus sp. MNP-M23 TaxID=3072793 RepID=UPI002814C2D4|nr:5-oxoprolinase subunit PxpA [Acuticoccus sp. MNP-M23]WMS44255.1 5-oxoprolinase subunit PxpA [Acuticoccus sp. MNP-M23]
MTTVDLNADCGESFGPWTMGADGEILKIVTSANIACGFHAGDPDTMAETIRTAIANNVAIGAHPGFEDKAGFGRRPIPMAPDAITRMVAYQIGATIAMAAVEGGRVTHVKAHGALSNVASADRTVADAIASAVRQVDPSLTLLAVATTALEDAGRAAGLPVAAEIFADRAYEPDGQLVSRAKPGAFVHDPAEAAARVVKMVEAGAIFAHDGSRLPTAIDSICVHGDSADAVAIAKAVRAALEGAGVTVTPFAG